MLCRINKGKQNSIQVAMHKIQGTLVAIKSMTKKQLKNLQKNGRISEAEALLLC